ncbi:MAG: hypothetical protein KDD65_16545 [Bacteroidetes bacterium]|nr:hypothetical protein [Bacteroidota bacterium]
MNGFYLFSLLVGGFFVILSAVGFGEHESDTDFDADADVDLDVDADADVDLSADHDVALEAEVVGDADHDFSVGGHDAGVGFIDLFSLRAVFLFMAFFGFCGFMLNLIGDGAEPVTALFSFAFGAIAGLGGNWVIKNFAYRSVSSDVKTSELQGQTAKVLLPFGTEDKGKILLTAKGQTVQLVAKSLSDETSDVFAKGDEVVIVRMNGRIAEVVKPT